MEFCSSADDQLAIYDEVYVRVRWHRFEGYWLARLFEQVAHLKPTSPVGAIESSCQHAEAQLRHSYEDFGVHSYENAYVLLGVIGKYLEGDTEKFLQRYLTKNIATMHELFTRYLGAFPYNQLNPLGDHPLTMLTWSDLREVYHHLPPYPSRDSSLLNEVVSDAAEDPYCRIVARRFLGYSYMASGDLDFAEEQFQLAVDESEAVGLDAETGHSLRSLAHAQLQMKTLESALKSARRVLSSMMHMSYSATGSR